MVNDQEPRYRLVDADGNVVGSLFAESDGTLKLQEGTSGNDNELALTTEGALEVEQATVTNETFISADRSSATGSTSAGTFVALSDGTIRTDIRGEFNASGEFVPDKSGIYQIVVHTDIRGGTAEGDEITARIFDTDAGGRVNRTYTQQSPSGSAQLTFYIILQLDSGTPYQAQVTNDTSSFDLLPFESELKIARQLITP